jgi:Ca2+-binding EF-hand superfamily protein
VKELDPGNTMTTPFSIF